MGSHAFAAIVGTGFSGLAVAIELRRAGIDDLVLLERDAALGGTWRDNRYPGCACDIPSYLYSFSFASGYDWSRSYAPQPEIRDYLERVADAFDLRRHILFGRELVEAAWDEAGARWRLRARSGEERTANVLVLATGALSNPDIPRLPGIERFRGASFHSARWDHGVDLRGKRVAVVGTGASAIQIVPRIQPLVERLYVLQRTPPWIMPRGDRAYRPWQRALLRIGLVRRLYRQLLYWRLESRFLAFAGHPFLSRAAERLARRHMAKVVKDPRLRDLLTPRYRPGCKRILLSDEYYPAVVQPNVEVIGDAIEEVGERTVRLAGGRELAVDAIVYGTGFAVHDHLRGTSVIGRGGLELGALWRERAQAYLGTTVAGFPNLFVMTGPNTGLGHHSMVVVIEAQARWAARAIGLLRERRLAALEVKAEVQAAYNRWLDARLPATVWSSGCRSWYLDARGRNTALWPGFVTALRGRLALPRPEDFEQRPAAGGVTGG